MGSTESVARESVVSADLRSKIIDDIVNERKRQENLKHGGDTAEFDKQNSANDWISYIIAYAGRAARKVGRNDREFCLFRENMVKVAALALASIEAYDSKYITD